MWICIRVCIKSSKWSIIAHYQEKSKHVLKFISFIQKNIDFPFWVKKKVFDTALMSAILYSAEALLTKDIAHLEPAYMTWVKTLLGVRRTTNNIICRIELGVPSLSAKVRKIQKEFFARILVQRDGMSDDPFNYVWLLCSVANTKASVYVKDLLNGEDPVVEDLNKTREKIQNCKEQASKLLTYKQVINPALDSHPIYSTTCNLYEKDRIITTRIRTSSHNLRIETGRWSCISRDNRLCQCGKIQTESHILLECPLTEPHRTRFPGTYSNIESLFLEPDLKLLTNTVSKIYQHIISLQNW